MIHHNHHDHGMHGTGTVGEKGQIVIPASAREALDIKTGDKFIFFRHGRMLHMVKADELNDFLDKINNKFTENISKFRQKFEENSEK
jgi:AbrB family looped-hinge helix DNA binding protein